jgi:hypothetical protein
VKTPLQDGRYLLLGRLGRGGMASVYRAFDRVRQRIVALKVQTDLQRAGPAHPLSAEFDALAQLRHPNIVSVYELEISRSGPLTRGAPYLVMEHARGRPAAEVLVPGRIAPSTLSSFTVQVLRGLRHIHAAGLIHRDVKPANLLTDLSGGRLRQVKLTDFGLAARSGLAEEPGKISGSLPYVSPEALLGQPLDERSDLYSLGIVLYVLSTGNYPFDDCGPEEVLRWHLDGAPADPGGLRPSLPGRLARFVSRLTEKDPADRPRRAADALAQLGSSEPREPRRAVGASKGGDRAALRLALDATRLGARRRFIVATRTRELVREVRVWCQVRDVGFHQLGSGPADSERSLADVILRLLIERGEGARSLMRRYAIDRWLPLRMLGDLPLRELNGAKHRNGRPSRSAGPAGRQLCDFILACSAARPLVLSVEPTVAPGTLARAVLAELRRAVEPPRPPRPGTGGLLLLERRADRA